MIAVTTNNKRRRCEGRGDNTLAYTKVGEYAVYVNPQDCDLFAVDGSDSAISPSGEEWYPSILNNGRLTAFIPGNPGAGKSYLARELIELLPKDYQVLLFTSVEEDDGNFAPIKDRVHRIRMEKDNIERMSLSAIRKVCEHPILLFDDVDKIRDKEVEKKVFALMEDALANGRDHKTHDGTHDVHVIITNHALNDYKKTKYSLENSDYVAVFPLSTTYMQMQRLFAKLGLEKNLCDRVIMRGKTDGIRRVIIHKVAPMYIIIGDEISLI